MSHAQPIRHTTYICMYWYVRLIRDWYAYICIGYTYNIPYIHTYPSIGIGQISYIRTYPRQRYRVLVEFLVKNGTRRLVCSCCFIKPVSVVVTAWLPVQKCTISHCPAR